MIEFKPANIQPPEVRDIAGNRIRRAIDAIREPGASLGDRAHASEHIRKSVFNYRREYSWGDPEFIRWPRLTAMINHLGLPAEEVVAHWEASKGNARWSDVRRDEWGDTGASSLHSIFENNVSTMLNLETARPTATKVLADQFGIHNFIRFKMGNFIEPPDQLIAQYDQRDDTSKPYGIVVAAYDDHNGAYGEADYKLYHVRKEFGDSVAIRGYEAEGYRGPNGLKARLEQAQERYTPDETADGTALFGVVHAHSSGFKLILDKYGSDSLDVTDPLFQDPKETTGDEEKGWSVFSPDATVIFGSCSTGVPGGLANRLANRVGIKTIGPDEVTSINKITVKKESLTEIKVEYSKGQAVGYPPHAPMQEIREQDKEKYAQTIFESRFQARGNGGN